MRTFIQALRLTLATALMCLAATAAQAQRSNVTIKVASFAGPFGDVMQRYIADVFTRRTGIKVEFSFANPADFLAQMIASKGRRPPFDVVTLDDDVTADAIRSGVLQKIDPSIITNMKHLVPHAIDKEGYGPAIFYFSFGIAYHKTKLAEAGIPAPKSWNDLWDPRLSGHISIPDIINIQGRDFVIQIARLNGGSEAAPEVGIQKIAQIKAHSYNTASNTLQAQFEAGDVWIAPWNSQRAAGMALRGLPIGFVIPSEGSIGNTDTINVVAGTSYPKEAQMFINEVLDPFGQLAIFKLLPLGMTNSLVLPILTADPANTERAPLTKEALEKLYFPDWKTFNTNLRKTTDLWNRTIRK